MNNRTNHQIAKLAIEFFFGTDLLPPMVSHAELDLKSQLIEELTAKLDEPPMRRIWGIELPDPDFFSYVEVSDAQPTVGKLWIKYKDTVLNVIDTEVRRDEGGECGISLFLRSMWSATTYAEWVKWNDRTNALLSSPTCDFARKINLYAGVDEALTHRTALASSLTRASIYMPGGEEEIRHLYIIAPSLNFTKAFNMVKAVTGINQPEDLKTIIPNTTLRMVDLHEVNVKNLVEHINYIVDEAKGEYIDITVSGFDLGIIEQQWLKDVVGKINGVINFIIPNPHTTVPVSAERFIKEGASMSIVKSIQEKVIIKRICLEEGGNILSLYGDVFDFPLIYREDVHSKDIEEAFEVSSKKIINLYRVAS